MARPLIIEGAEKRGVDASSGGGAQARKLYIFTYFEVPVHKDIFEQIY